MFFHMLAGLTVWVHTTVTAWETGVQKGTKSCVYSSKVGLDCFILSFFFSLPVIKTQLYTDERSALGVIVCFCARKRHGKVNIA